jgi:hypothetical protein
MPARRANGEAMLPWYIRACVRQTVATTVRDAGFDVRDAPVPVEWIYKEAGAPGDSARANASTASATSRRISTSARQSPVWKP